MAGKNKHNVCFNHKSYLSSTFLKDKNTWLCGVSKSEKGYLISKVHL